MKIDSRTTMKLVAAQMRDCVEMADMIGKGLEETRSYKNLQKIVNERQKILDAFKALHDMPDDMPEHPYNWEGEGEF